MSQRERLRWKIAKWRRITHEVRKWSGTLKTAYTRKWGGKGFWTQECLSNLRQKIDTPDLSNSDRRKALLEECETQIGKATSEFLDCEAERGQKLTEKMEEGGRRTADCTAMYTSLYSTSYTPSREGRRGGGSLEQCMSRENARPAGPPLKKKISRELGTGLARTGTCVCSQQPQERRRRRRGRLRTI